MSALLVHPAARPRPLAAALSARLATASLARAGAPASPSTPVGPRLLIFGVGDVRMGDEGAGAHVVRSLVYEPAMTGVRLRDGGRAGIALLPQLDGISQAIIVSAVADGRVPGTIRYGQLDELNDLGDGIGTHLCGLRDLLAVAALLGRLPVLHLYSISVSYHFRPGLDLSPPIAVAIPVVTWMVHGHAARLVQAGRMT